MFRRVLIETLEFDKESGSIFETSSISNSNNGKINNILKLLILKAIIKNKLFIKKKKLLEKNFLKHFI